MIAIANCLNLFLPSKLGDLSKTLIFKKEYDLPNSQGVPIVISEKIFDLLSIFIIFLIASSINPLPNHVPSIILPLFFSLFIATLLFATTIKPLKRIWENLSRFLPKSAADKAASIFEFWLSYQALLINHKLKVIKVTLLSILFSMCHLVQFWFFLSALNEWIPIFDHFQLSIIAVLSALIPLSVSGIGIRDMAIVQLYTPLIPYYSAATLGLLITIRNIIYASIGLPFVSYILGDIKRSKSS